MPVWCDKSEKGRSSREFVGSLPCDYRKAGWLSKANPVGRLPYLPALPAWPGLDWLAGPARGLLHCMQGPAPGGCSIGGAGWLEGREREKEIGPWTFGPKPGYRLGRAHKQLPLVTCGAASGVPFSVDSIRNNGSRAKMANEGRHEEAGWAWGRLGWGAAMSVCMGQATSRGPWGWG